MAWTGSLDLRYRLDPATHRSGHAPRAPRTVCHDRHDGPLRVLASLYPEGDAVCHNVMVHPPGGIVGGDRLDIDVQIDGGAHALITTPGATRFYRSLGETAVQSLTARVAGGSRLEWLPTENIAYSGTLAENRARFELAEGAEMIGWDMLALGLPASGQAFEKGSYTQQIDLPGVWRERGRVDAADRRLLDSPLGFAGCKAMATMWFAVGGVLDATRRDALIDAARELTGSADSAPGDSPAASPVVRAGVTAPHENVVVLRALAPHTEALTRLLVAVWSRWRRVAWDLQATAPRIWRM